MANNKFCTECGQRLEEGVKFCPNCGKVVPAEANGQEPQNNTYTPNDTPNYSPNYTPGFSTRIHDPEINAALRRTRSISRVFLLISIPIPVVVASIYALVTGEMELGQAIIGGAVVSGIILLINFLIGMSHSAKNSYEAVVIDKKYEYDHKTNDSTKKQCVYKTIVRTPQTATKKSFRKRAIFRDPPMNTLVSATGSVTIRSSRILMKNMISQRTVLSTAPAA